MSSRPHRSAPAAHRHVAPVHRGPQAIAPVHRGPQAMSPTALSNPHHAPNAALLIDFDNVTMGIRSELQTELKNLLSSDIVKGKVSVQRAYADWRRYPQYIVPLAESSSDLLVMNCDEYYSYNALAGLVKSGEEEVVKKDPWELVTEAITRMKRNGDVMRADRLKQVMQQIDSSFDEKNLGMSKFSRFVTEAAQRGLLSLTKLENGQFEVGPPRTAGVLPSGEPAAVSAVARIATPRGEDTETSDRPRRSRRGGRGRDRDREGRTPRPVAAHSPTPTETE